jgi:hypothetical protein
VVETLTSTAITFFRRRRVTKSRTFPSAFFAYPARLPTLAPGPCVLLADFFKVGLASSGRRAWVPVPIALVFYTGMATRALFDAAQKLAARSV